MVQLVLSFALAAALVFSGVAVEYGAITTNSPLKFAVALIAMGLGVVWLWSTIKETWRHLTR